jgi:hypothetical protein
MFLCLTIQISRARRADEKGALRNGAMVSGGIVCESGVVKGVALWRLVRLFSFHRIH